MLKHPVAWRIDSWDPSTGRGSVRSPHFGPIEFGPAQNTCQVDDFGLGEAVWVELEGEAPNFRATEVFPFCQRQPAGTELPDLEPVSCRGDVYVEESSPGEIKLWIGECCGWCCADPKYLTFHGVTYDGFEASSEDSADCVLFRAATRGEIAEQGLRVANDCRAYCIVTGHGNGRDGPKLFVVARGTTIEDAPSAHRL